MYQIIVIFFIIFFVYILFYLFTKKTRYIKIMKKFRVNNKIMKIIDDANIEYIIEENLIMSEKKCHDVWDNLVEDDYNYITYYGCNYPILGLKYHII